MPSGRTPNDSTTTRRLVGSRRNRAALCSGICAALVSAAFPTRAAPDLKQPAVPLLATRLPMDVSAHEPMALVHSIFHIDKSENRNQVHYGARVDEACRPVGSSPIYAYWRMRERGPYVTEGLLGHEQPAYGIESQQVAARQLRGGKVHMRLRAWPDRPVKLELFRSPQGCAARALLKIQRAPAVLRSIYIELGFLFSVKYALLRGVHLTDGSPLQEKLQRNR